MIKLNIQDMNELVKNKGKCLSEKYTNDKAKLLWYCNNSHEFYYSPKNIKRGSWCAECNNQKKLIFLQNIAKSRNGSCLSEKYIDTKTKLSWKCNKDGNIWNASASAIKQGSWCAECSGIKKGNIEKIQEIVKSKGGRCLSVNYINNNTKLKIECDKKHIWYARPRVICSGYWCPKCYQFKSELLCKKYLDQYTNKKFIKSSPKWLQGLELDGYCKELKLAFEYNGIQHYKIDGFFKQNKKEFLNQQRRDKLKRKLCKLNGVKLITIPYKYNCYDPQKMYKFIDAQLK